MKTRIPFGFTLLELLVSTGILLLLAAGVLMVALPSHGAFRVQPAALNIQQRLRALAQPLQVSVTAAGSGPVNGLFGLPLGATVPSVLPFRIGARRPDPPGHFHSDVVTAISAVPAMAASRLSAEFEGSAGTITVIPVAGCPVGDLACGLREDMSVLLVDASGQWDLYGVSSVAGAQVVLVARGPASGRRYSTETRVVPVDIATYYLRAGVPDGPQLASYDGNGSDLPLADHAVVLEVEYFADGSPPRRRPSAGSGAPLVTYGPPPPLVGEDDPRDSWGAGENCIVALEDGRQVARLEAWPPEEALSQLSAAQLTDGPWCPDPSSAVRFDADLLRIRRVRVTVRLETWHESLRGADSRLFLRPGRSPRPEAAPDEQVTLDLVPRALAVGR